MSRSAALEAARLWVDAALPSLTETILARQLNAGTVRPDLPYATLEWLRDRAPASVRTRVGDESAPGDPDGLTHDYHVEPRRIGVVQIVVYGSTGPDLMNQLTLSRNKEAIREQIRSAGIAVQELGDVVDTLELRDTVHEPSALQDWAVSYGAQLTDVRIGTITSLEEDIDLEYEGE